MYVSLLLSAVYLLGLFSISQFIFNPLNLYYELWWLDIPMHVLGGFGVAWFFIALTSFFHKKHSLKNIFILTLLVMVSWEIFEYLMNLNDLRTWIGWQDTIADIINGFIGMFISYKVFSK